VVVAAAVLVIASVAWNSLIVNIASVWYHPLDLSSMVPPHHHVTTASRVLWNCPRVPVLVCIKDVWGYHQATTVNLLNMDCSHNGLGWCFYSVIVVAVIRMTRWCCNASGNFCGSCNCMIPVGMQSAAASHTSLSKLTQYWHN